jgi:site-specific DNA-methyltransferase (adenine-specific)/modification methylase
MTEFSALRSSAGFELLDVVQRFDAPFPDVARWETGLEDAPAQILDALRRESGCSSTTERPGVENTLWEGDCLQLMKQIPDGAVHLVLCDLPYGTTQNRWDSVIDLRRLWREYRRVLKPNGVVVLTAQGVFTAKLILSNEEWFKYKLVWEKSKPTNFLNAKKQPLRKHEDVCIFYGKPPTYNPQMSEGRAYSKGVRKNQLTGSYGDFEPVLVQSEGGRYPTDVVYFKTAESEAERTVWHPTQKPVELGRYLIRTFSDEGDLVLDNAFGSGSFLVAAALENRKFVGIEKNEEVHLFKNERIDYVALAEDRLVRSGASVKVVRR